jgi:protein HIRA/HIR1
MRIVDDLAHAPEKSREPKLVLLAELNAHSLAVNCVAFSPSGKYLASGSDDKTIIIWEQRPLGTPGFGMSAGGSSATENWSTVTILRDHKAGAHGLTI